MLLFFWLRSDCGFHAVRSAFAGLPVMTGVMFLMKGRASPPAVLPHHPQQVFLILRAL